MINVCESLMVSQDGKIGRLVPVESSGEYGKGIRSSKETFLAYSPAKIKVVKGRDGGDYQVKSEQYITNCLLESSCLNDLKLSDTVYHRHIIQTAMKNRYKAETK